HSQDKIWGNTFTAVYAVFVVMCSNFFIHLNKVFNKGFALFTDPCLIIHMAVCHACISGAVATLLNAFPDPAAGIVLHGYVITVTLLPVILNLTEPVRAMVCNNVSKSENRDIVPPNRASSVSSA